MFFIHQDGVAVGGVLAQGGEPVAQAAFGREGVVLKAKSQGIVGVARFAEVSEGLSAVPLVGDLPAVEEEDGDGVEGGPAAGRGPTQPLSQDRAQGAAVDQAQEQVEVREVFPGGRVFQVLPAEVDAVGAVGVLGRGRDVGRGRPVQGEAMPQSIQAALGHEG